MVAAVRSGLHAIGVVNVPIGHLLAVVVIAVPTILVVRPARRPPALGRASFLSGVVLGEMPVLGVVWLLLWSALAIGQGDLTTPAGSVVAGLAVTTVAALVVVAARGARARSVVVAAVGRDLPHRSRRQVVQALLWPFWVRRRDVVRLADLSYGPAGTENLLDTYRSRHRPPGGPMLVYLHGGGFHGGRKNREARALLYRLAALGWVCVSANYRLQPSATLSDQLADVRQVMAWARDHGHEHGGDASTLVLAGSSAGAYLAAMTALMVADETSESGAASEPAVTAVVCLYGYYGRYYQETGSVPRERSSPEDRIGAGAPPFFVAHGDHDTLVVVDSARQFTGRLGAASSRPVVYAELPGAQHGFDLVGSLRFGAVVDGVVAFLHLVRAEDQAGER